MIDFEDTKKILLSNDYIYDFMMGNWTGSYGKYLSYTRKPEGGTQSSYNIPWLYYGDYYKLEDDKHYNVDHYSWYEQWKITIINANQIEVYCYDDYPTYTLYR